MLPYGVMRFLRFAVVGAVLAAGLGLAASAQAAYTAHISNQTLLITGNSASDKLALRLKRGARGTLQVDVGANGSANFSFARSKFKRILVRAGGGSDLVRIVETNGVFTDKEKTTFEGGRGPDDLTGGAGPERFVWRAGDGSDTVDGRSGADVFVMNGSAAAESFHISPNFLFVRVEVDAGAANDHFIQVERLDLNAGGGDDTITGTDGLKFMTTLDLDGGSGADTISGGDGADLIRGGPGVEALLFGAAGNDLLLWKPGDGSESLDGGADNDRFQVSGSTAAETFAITANVSRVTVTRDVSDAVLDIGTVETLDLNTLGGTDTINAGLGLAPLIALDLDGGDGPDTILGGDGADLIFGGNGNDALDGNRGNDIAFLGVGNDNFTWDPGDGSDVVEGQAGADLLAFNGSGANENIDMSANGSRFRFFRDVASITMDVNGVERVGYQALGGADTITVNNLAGTAVTRAEIDLEGTVGSGSGDAQIDNIIVNGTPSSNTVQATAASGEVSVAGLAAKVFVAHPEAANDRVTVNGLGGGDQLSGATGLAP
jgi:Ca2+-binding RTX toxin-like protein